MSDETAVRADDCAASEPGNPSPATTAELAEISCQDPVASARAKLQSGLESLRPIGAHQFNPTRLYYIEALAERASRQPAQVALPLLDRALYLLEGYLTSSAQTREQNGNASSQITRRSSDKSALATSAVTASDNRVCDTHRMQRQLQNGRQLDAITSLTQRLNAQPPASPGNDRNASFAEQLRLQEQALTNAQEARPRSSGNESDSTGALDGLSSEQNTPAQCGKGVLTLKAARRGDEANSRMRTRLVLGRAIAQCPAESGPLNPQALIVQSLKTMSDLSPDYVHRLTTQLDTLHLLDQVASQRSSERAARKKHQQRDVANPTKHPT